MCYGCSGTGSVMQMDYLTGRIYYTFCYQCLGSGRINCINCSGKGRCTCATCHGTKKIPCPDCEQE